MQKRFVYVLRSDRDLDRHYVGVTANVKERLYWHNTGAVAYPARFRPWRVIASIEFTEQAALAFERYLKTGSGRAFAKRHFP